MYIRVFIDVLITGKDSPSEKKKSSKESIKSSKDLNKENKSKKDVKNAKNAKETKNNKKTSKSKEKAAKAAKRKTLPDRKRGSEADDTRMSKKLREEYECSKLLAQHLEVLLFYIAIKVAHRTKGSGTLKEIANLSAVSF